MPPSVLEMAKDLVQAQIQSGQLTPDEMGQALQETHANLISLQARQDQVEAGEGPVAGSPPRAMTWRQSITRHAIMCLECGASFKQLSIRHLRLHDLDARSYREKYGIPRMQSLAARDTTARRRQVVQETRPWEKSPRYLSAQSQETAASTGRAAAKKAATKKASVKKKKAPRS